MKPSSHINFITCGYVVRFPNKEPLVGALSAPQSFASNTKEKKKENNIQNILANQCPPALPFIEERVQLEIDSCRIITK